MKSIFDFQKKKNSQQKITMLTCYDSTFAQILADTSLDMILVGDSVAQVLHGHSTTLNATTHMIALHTQAVVRAAPQKFIIADMPFLSTRKGLENTMNQIEILMQAGAQAVKIENADGHLELIRHIVNSGVPVMGHLGLTPQSIHQLGGPKVQGKSESAGQKILSDALNLQDAGAFAIVLECIPSKLAEVITKELQIPTIGIGAGPQTDGQVLVLQDMLGLNPKFSPKFLKKYLDGYTLTKNAFEAYINEVSNSQFPTTENSYE